MANETNANFELFKLKTSPKPTVPTSPLFVDNRKKVINVFSGCESANPYGFGNSILCPSSYQQTNWLNKNAGLYQMPSIWNAAATTSTCTSSCSNSNSGLSTKDMIIGSLLSNPQALQVAGNLVGGLFNTIAGWFGAGDNKNTQGGVQVGDQSLTAGTKGIFRTEDGKFVQGSLNEDGTVTAADGKNYKVNSYAGEAVGGAPSPAPAPSSANDGAPAADTPADKTTPKTDKPADTKADKPATNGTQTKATATETTDSNIKRADNLINEYKSAPDDKKDEIKGKFDAEIKNLNSQKGAAESSLSLINGDITKLEAELNEIEKKAEADFANAKEAFTKQKGIADKAKTEMKTKADAEARAKGALDQRTDEHNDAKAELSAANNAYTQAENAFNTIKAKYDAATPEEKTNLQAEYDKARTAKEEAQKRKANAEKREKIANKARQEANKEYQTAKDAHVEAKDTYNKENDKLKPLETKYKEAQSKLGEKNPDYKTKLAEKTEKEQEKANLEAKINNYDLKINELTGFKEQAKSQLDLDDKGNLTGYKSSLSEQA